MSDEPFSPLASSSSSSSEEAENGSSSDSKSTVERTEVMACSHSFSNEGWRGEGERGVEVR